MPPWMWMFSWAANANASSAASLAVAAPRGRGGRPYSARGGREERAPVDSDRGATREEARPRRNTGGRARAARREVEVRPRATREGHRGPSPPGREDRGDDGSRGARAPRRVGAG